MLKERFISLKPLQYLVLLGIPFLLFVFSLMINIFYRIDAFWILALILTSIWLLKVLRYICYKTYKIRISKQELFEIIDTLVERENWEYGDIKDNVITLHVKNSLRNGKNTIFIKYFDYAIWITNISAPTELVQIIQEPLDKNITTILTMIKWKVNENDKNY